MLPHNPRHRSQDTRRAPHRMVPLLSTTLSLLHRAPLTVLHSPAVTCLITVTLQCLMDILVRTCLITRRNTDPLEPRPLALHLNFRDPHEALLKGFIRSTRAYNTSHRSRSLPSSKCRQSVRRRQITTNTLDHRTLGQGSQPQCLPRR